MNAEEIRKEITDSPLTKEEFIQSLVEELYRIPFHAECDDVYPMNVTRFGRESLSIEMYDGSKFIIKIS